MSEECIAYPRLFVPEVACYERLGAETLVRVRLALLASAMERTRLLISALLCATKNGMQSSQEVVTQFPSVLILLRVLQ